MTVIPRAINFSDGKAVSAMIKLVRDTVLDEPISMVVVDTLARAMPGVDENSAQEVGAVIAICDKLKEELECTVVPIHHQGKDASKGFRGSSAILGAVDASFHIVTERGRVTLTPEEQKEGDPGAPIYMDMVRVDLPSGKSSIVPVLSGGGPDMAGHEPDIAGQSGIAYRALIDTLAERGAIMPAGSGLPPDTHGVKAEDWRQAFYLKLPGIAVDARQKAFKRAIETLLRKRVIGVRDPWVWKVIP